MRETEETKDLELIEEMLQSPRAQNLPNTTDFGKMRLPDEDGQQAALRRIEDAGNGSFYQDRSKPDPTLPVLEHVVTPSFVRTVDKSSVNEEFDRLFSEDTLEDESGNLSHLAQYCCVQVLKIECELRIY